MQPIVNEQSSAWVTVSVRGRTGQPEAPATLSYRIDCLTSRTLIRASTPLTPAAEVEIALTPADSRIVDSERTEEQRAITVIAGFPGGEQLTAEYRWTVRALAGVVT